MGKTNNSTVPAFGMKDRLGYMFGDFGNDFTFIVVVKHFCNTYG